MSSDKCKIFKTYFLTTSGSKNSRDSFSGQWCQASGIITWFDNFCMLLRRDGHSQLVYKHAISTVMPVTPVSFTAKMTMKASSKRPKPDLTNFNGVVGTTLAHARSYYTIPEIR